MKRGRIIAILVGVVVVASMVWAWGAYQERKRYLDAHPFSGGNFLQEIAYYFREHSYTENAYQKEKTQEHDYKVRELFTDDVAQKEADLLLERSLGHAEVQKRLSNALAELRRLGAEARWQHDRLGWQAFVSEDLAEVMGITLKEWDSWWQDIQRHPTLAELVQVYPDLDHLVWDLYLQRNDIRLAYENEYLAL